MVYFTCDACGEQLKKPSVDKHYQQKCRDCYKLTCIDCLKDFYGDEYKNHNACMTEDQRYSKEGRSGWDPSKGSGHKGEKKQNVWMANLRNILAETKDLESDVKNIVNTILDHENIPRKRPKFINFVKNIMRNRASSHSIDKTWDLFSQALKPTPEPETIKMEEDKVVAPVEVVEEETKPKEKKKKKKKNDSSNNVVEEETSEKENVEVKKKSKKKDKQKNEETNKPLKRKREEAMEVDDATEDNDASPIKKVKFDWDDTIMNVLKKKGNEMKLNKLKKKCVSEYMAQCENNHKSEAEIGAKFDKKLKKKKYRVLKDRVKLVVADEEDANDVTVEEVVKKDTSTNDTETTQVNDNKSKNGSFNNWESANLGSSTQNEKFRRLMGIKNPSNTGNGTFGGNGRNDKQIFRDLEQGFEKARQVHFGPRCFDV